ncbi:hypothetical protein N6H18_17890 [Reichenbachiella agarivorans]|uniref:Uncharacterized protein n=1 Tax=Reichenbachiella agarivorans TaxID=2979464 RepID=A0ABY6CNV0_9BACT|nr:hypothetical protein [Reichenbachiella agarivorans]UXP32214.1 hypothetical protein N6H18_17890 [Reichenbachiella agarivorans]
MKKYKGIILIMVLGVLAFGCYDDREEDFAFEPFTEVLFPYSSGEWTAIDNLTIEVESVDLQSANVEAILEGTVINLGTVNFSNGIATIQTTWSEIKDANRIDVIAEDANTGNEFRTKYSITKAEPMSTKAPATVHNDSTATVQIKASTRQTNIKSIKLFRKYETEDTFQEVYSQALSSLTFDGEYSFVVPKESDLGLNTKIYFRSEIVSEAGLMAAQEIEMLVIPIELNSVGEEILTLDGANSFNLSSMMIGSEDDIDAENQDVILVSNANTLELISNAVSGTEYVISEDFDFETADFQSVRDAYAMGTPSSKISDLTVGISDISILIKVGKPTSKSNEYAVIRILEIVKSSEGSTTVRLSYKGRL